MDILDKYENAIRKIQEMCTSTVATAPYPVGGISVTTIRRRQSKGRSHKPMLNYKYTKQWTNKDVSIVEAIKEIASVCESILNEVEAVKPRKIRNAKDFREFYQEYQDKAAQNREHVEKKGSKAAINNLIDRVKKWRAAAKGTEPIHCNYVSEGRHAKVIDPNLWRKMKNMKYIDPDFYNLSPEEQKKVLKTLDQQKIYQNQMASAEAEGDQARQNILGGQIKRTQNIARRQTKEARAKIWKSMGKRLQSQIVRDPARMKKKD